jgi:NADH:ubiquinone oxidoreductase subunit F (NADH-binding)/(2Fe-2S) ferredoxin/NAD-dependent dihydropyrimidine dehydrogenase PreA subunit
MHCRTIGELTNLRKALQEDREKARHTLILSSGTCGQACGSGQVAEALAEGLRGSRLNGAVHLRVTGCHGFCEQEPLLIVEPQDLLYCRIKPEDIPEIISETLEQGKVVERLLYSDPSTGRKISCESELPFYRHQDRTLIGRNRLVDPRQITDYIASGGYASLAAALSRLEPEQVIEEIKRSGLRGRGGGGFPTGRKWESCRRATGSPKYVICNADEGDPGAYMDRSLLEGNPHSIIEGMLIGAYAIGAEQGYIYVRNEYPLAVEHARIAIEQARSLGLLGENILGSSFSFDLQIARGAGAFVCGESTALMASLAGGVGEPSPKDVHTVEKGFLDRPTNLNNVETWANVPLIIEHGADRFAAKGTAASKGTKIFALTGKVRNTGLVEVPMGTPLARIVYDIGGGASDGAGIKAVQIGGPSGGCLPAELLHLPVDFEAMTEAGTMVGSGGLVVMDSRTCMVDVARYFLDFLIEESCGKCFPCRVGLPRMREIVTDICNGEGTMEKLELLQETAETVSKASLCALGKTAANPVFTTIRYFEDEYRAHILEKRCPAGVCKPLIRYRIDQQRCRACGACAKICPQQAITVLRKGGGKSYLIQSELCSKCGTCRQACAFEAIEVVQEERCRNTLA